MRKKVLFGVLYGLASILLAAAVGVGVYFFNQEPELPRLHFEGDISNMESKQDVRSISVRFEAGKESFEGFAQLKVQGTSSLAYEKKNYTIKLYADETHSEKLPVELGWGAQNEYCLKANWIDKTHARNIVTAKLVSQMQDKVGLLKDAPANGAIDGFPIEVYSNGVFLGIYTWNIPKDAWMFGMDEDNTDHLVVCGEGWEPTNLFMAEPDFTAWSVEVGEESEENLNRMKRLFDFVMNSSDEEFKEQFAQYMDLDAALNYYIMLDVAFLADNRGKNILLATYDGQVWYPLLYDMDASWGTNWNGSDVYNYKEDPVSEQGNNLFMRIEKVFAQELSERYHTLRKNILSRDHIMDEFTDFVDQIPRHSFEKEVVRWGKEIPGRDLSQIEEYLDCVLPALDEKYAQLGK